MEVIVGITVNLTFFAAVGFLSWDIFKVMKDRLDFHLAPIIVQSIVYACVFMLVAITIAKIIRFCSQL